MIYPGKFKDVHLSNVFLKIPLDQLVYRERLQIRKWYKYSFRSNNQTVITAFSRGFASEFSEASFRVVNREDPTGTRIRFSTTSQYIGIRFRKTVGSDRTF